MAILCRERSLPLFLIAFPHAEQYRRQYLDRDRDYVLKPQNNLQSICVRLGISFLDLYPILDKSHFNEDGIHLTAEGRSVTALTIDEFIRKIDLIPRVSAE